MGMGMKASGRTSDSLFGLANAGGGREASRKNADRRNGKTEASLQFQFVMHRPIDLQLSLWRTSAQLPRQHAGGKLIFSLRGFVKPEPGFTKPHNSAELSAHDLTIYCMPQKLRLAQIK